MDEVKEPARQQGQTDEVVNAQVEVKGQTVEASYEPDKEAPKVPQTPEEMRQRLEAIRATLWNAMVGPHRQKLATKLGIEPSEVVMEGDGLKYTKLAFDNRGLFAMPKGHGRLKPRIKAHGALLRDATVSKFHNMFGKLEEQVKAKLPEGVAFDGLTQEQVKDLGAVAATLAAKNLNGSRRLSKKQARQRHRSARRVGFGTLAGNRARNIHSSR